MVWLVSNSPVLGFHLYITLSILWLFPGGDRWTDVHHEGKQFLLCVRNKTQKQAQLREYLPAGHEAVCKRPIGPQEVAKEILQPPSLPKGPLHPHLVSPFLEPPSHGTHQQLVPSARRRLCGSPGRGGTGRCFIPTQAAPQRHCASVPGWPSSAGCPTGWLCVVGPVPAVSLSSRHRGLPPSPKARAPSICSSFSTSWLCGTQLPLNPHFNRDLGKKKLQEEWEWPQR